MAELLPGSSQAPGSANQGEKPETSEEMEAWLLDRIDVTADDLNQLAARRAAQVRDYILGTQQVESGRVFLGGSAPADAPSGRRAYLSLE